MMPDAKSLQKTMFKVAILHNPGSKVVEMVDGKQIELKSGDNVLPFTVVQSIKGFTNRGYTYKTPSQSEQPVACPLCGNIIKESVREEDKKPTGATTQTLPSAVQKPEESQQQKVITDEDLEKIPKDDLYELCVKQGLIVDKRMGTKILIEKLKETFK